MLALALADKLKQARKQLSIHAKTSLLYAAIESANPRRDGLKDSDRLRSDLVDGAFAALAEDGLLEIRDLDAFNQRVDAITKTLFGEAMRRLNQAEAILIAVAEVRAALESKLMGWARANLDDMRAHLDALVAPGFLRDVPAQRDPTRDQARLLELQPFVTALTTADREDPEAKALRWDLEELRVQLFAQELGSKAGVSPKRLATRLTRLRST